MTRLGFLAIPFVIAGATVGCSQSHGNERDGAIAFDAGPISDAAPPGPRCGNGDLEPGEMCDDGNTLPGDGCDAECARESHCGDGTTDPGEACDDGNNVSGDGCRSDCGSDESCGNGIVDYAAGEICDSTPGCDPTTCASVAGCGDGSQMAPEACDDGNTRSFDGCDAACKGEIAMRIDSLAMANPRHGCDVTGDGEPDNAFASSLPPLAAGLLNGILGEAIESGDLTLLLAFLGLDDPVGVSDDDFRIAWLQGMRAAALGQYVVDPASINPDDGSARTSIQCSADSGELACGPETIPLPLPLAIDVALEHGQLQGRTSVSGGAPARIEGGLLCGGIPVRLLAVFGAFLAEFVEIAEPCSGTEPAGLADLAIAGGTVDVMGLPLVFTATPPDLDLDGDGLEGFEIVDEGPAGCQPVVVACTDGDGTRIPGRGCYAHLAIADGFSAAFEFTAAAATLVPAP